QTGTSMEKVLRVAIPNLAIFVVLWLWNSNPWRRRGITAIPYEKEPLLSKVVIAMVSKGGGSQTARAAAEFHKDKLEHVWLITTPLAEDDARLVARDIEAF